MAKQHSNTIELNGRRYDARTGDLVQDLQKAHPAVVTNLAPVKPALKSIARRPVIDGFVRATSPTARQIHAQPSKSVTLKRAAVPKQPIVAAIIQPTNRPALTQAKPLPAHQPTKSPTLMRAAVKKPVIARKPKLAASAHTASLVAKPAQGIVAKKMSDVVDTDRLDRAYHTAQHTKVTRFYKPTRLVAAVPMTAQHVPVTPAPQMIRPTNRPASPAQPVDIFSRGLQAARSHESTYQAPKKHPRRAGKILAASAVSLALLGIVGSIGYLNRTTIQVQVAAAQSGFHANLPSYTPTGFAYHGINYGPGQVTLSYQAVATEASYQIIQQPSAWNSQTLLETFVTTTKQSYAVYQRSGQSVYVYGNNATWVSGGIWYQIQTKAQGLSTDQLLQIASSI